MQETDHNFYTRMQSTGNFLLMKSEVGKIRPSIHTLPSKSFIYGKLLERDKIHAEEMIYHWQSHKRNEETLQDIDFKLSNSISVSKGLSTPIQISKFRKEHKIRIKSKINPLQSTKKKLPSDITFGKPLRPSTPIKAVINNFYANYALLQKHEEYQVLKPEKNEKSKSLHNEHLQKSMTKVNIKPLFKMKKFLHTQSRTDCWRPNSSITNKLG